MREIGGEFWDVPVSSNLNSVFPSHTRWFLSGRCAISAILSDIKCKQPINTVAIPSWCCDSMIRPFVSAGIQVKFYPVMQPIVGIDADAIIVMDYFGYTGQNRVMDYSGLVLRDLTHSIISKTYHDADYYFGSLRKWAGFWTGGFAWGKWNSDKHIEEPNEIYTELRKEAMKQKEEYIDGKQCDKGYIEIFENAEELLDNGKINAATERDIILAQRLDVNYIRGQRKANTESLLDAVKKVAIFPKLNEMDCPMFVPIRVLDGKRDALRQFMIERDIYCPVHWPLSEFHKLDDASRQIYNEELSLICDQRYSVSDMERICETIDEFSK